MKPPTISPEGHEQQQNELDNGDKEKELNMLRTLYPTEPELVRLCRAKTWFSVERRSQSHPTEATPTAAALRGEGCTALSIAVRSRAPLHVLEYLLRADASQIGVTHCVRGTVLHEALKNRANDRVLEFLVHAAIHFDKSTEHRQSDCLLGTIDELGRTSLHYMVDRILRSLDRGEINRDSWNILRLMVEAYPDSVSIIDADGTTPLVLLLLIPKCTRNSQREPELEEEVYCMVKLMLSLCPRAVQVSRRLPRPWHYHFSYDQTTLVHGDGVPSPLSCALLHGRSVATIELLLDASRRIGVSACRSLVTHYREVPLHIAASMRCPANLLRKLVGEDSCVLEVSDLHGLTPLDWIWIRHTMDWCSSSDPFAPIMVSRRRYIHNNFMDWHGRVSNHYLGIDRSMEESTNPVVQHLSRQLKMDLLDRISILLPEMATRRIWEEWAQDRMDEDHDTSFRLPLMHAAATVPCPLAIVKLVCETCPDELRLRDPWMGRLPLHYAAKRGGYEATYPVGVSCNVHKMEEVSPLQMIMMKFPLAARVVDGQHRLALHIAIDYAKEAKHKNRLKRGVSMSSDDASTSSSSSEASIRAGHQEIGALLQIYPEALQRRDGATKLYPFQQAAQGHDGDVEMAFVLLRRDPSLVRTLR